MAWEVSFNAEVWQEIYDTLDTWTKEALIDAIMEAEGQASGAVSTAKRAFLEKYASHDCLAFLAYEWIERNRTCENGGNGFYIDAEGSYKVYLPEGSAKTRSAHAVAQ